MRFALLALAALGGFVGRPPADVHPVWSPDGTEIAYFRTGGGIRVVGADGTGDHPLTALPATSDFAFSPDWSWVAVVVFRSPAPTTLELMRPDGSDRRVLATDALTGAAPGFSPDGTQIAYASADGPRLVGVDGSGATALAARPSWWPVDEGSAVASDGRIARSAVGECGDRVGIYVDDRRVTNSCRVEGTDGPDRLRSSGALFQIVDGRGGDDVITGVGAAPLGDVLLGGAGNDQLTGGSLPDRLNGGPGDDTLHGGPNRDVLTGGPGRDRLDGEGGSDRIFARDGERDIVDCGTNTGRTNRTPERDVAFVDSLDGVSHCERVLRSKP